jgi:hypothetical protein
MAGVTAPDRLKRLVDLASQSAVSARGELVQELADLLLDWPANYPANMREPFETLLERAVGDVDGDTRAALAERFAGKEEAPLSLLNLLVFDAAPDSRKLILSRNASAGESGDQIVSPALNNSVVLSAIRNASAASRAAIIAERFGISEEVGRRILAEGTGYMLAVLCKGAQVGRATFSALAVLALPLAGAEENYRRLAVYDTVPENEAAALLSRWRTPLRAPASAAEAA